MRAGELGIDFLIEANAKSTLMKFLNDWNIPLLSNPTTPVEVLHGRPLGDLYRAAVLSGLRPDR